MSLYPGLIIDDVPVASGQRAVFFCHFNSENNGHDQWVNWGDVVLKISEGYSNQAIAYIQREIRILSELNSPGYPTLLHNEVITDDPETEERLDFKRFITIEERIQAKTLNEVMKNYNTQAEIVEFMIKLITTLRPLWDWKPPLVHRDLKPANILITPNDQVVVIDLGIVREEGSAGDTFTNFPFGPCTPKYASPEQASNDKKNITFKSDLFAIGILCYELMSNTAPFLHNTSPEHLDKVLHNVINYIPPTLAELNLCSTEFSNIIARMMEKTPYKRYRRIDDLLTDLKILRSQK